MIQSSKVHFYPHIMRTSALVATPLPRNKIYMYLVPPNDALTIENIFVHIRMTFDPSTPSANRILNYLGIASAFPFFIDGVAPVFKVLELNISADSNRKIDIKVDLTSLLDKNNAGYRNYFDTSPPNNLTYVVLKVDDALAYTATTAIIDLWKVDALFTIKKIP